MGTLRQEIIDYLKQWEMTAPELSEAVSIKEKEVYEHLEHIRRTVSAKKMKFIVRPYACRNCGFEFKDRNRLSRPGRCPRCKYQRIEDAGFRITGG